MAKYIKLLTFIIFMSTAVDSARACAFTINFTRNQPTCGSNGTLSFNLTPAPNAGAVYVIYKNGEFLVQINGNIANLNSLAPGSYKVVVTNNQTGCKDSLDNIILDPAINSLSATFKHDSSRCDTTKDAKITLKTKNATYPITYLWRKGLVDMPLEKDSFIDSLGVGTYHVTITDFSNCRYEIQDIKIKEIQGKMYAIDTIISPTSCDSPNGSIIIHIGGRHRKPGDSFVWQSRNIFGLDSNIMPLDSLKAGLYTCIFYDTLKCYPLEIKNIEIIQNKPPKGFIYGKDTVCEEGASNITTTLYVKVTSGDSNSVSYLWNNGIITKNNSGITAGNYNVIIKDNQGCADTPKYIVNQYPRRTFNLISDKDQIVKGIETFIKMDTTLGFYNIRWVSNPPKQYDVLTDSTRVRARPQVQTIYNVKANYGPSCETENNKIIYIIAAVDDLVIPNIFTPNGDSRNDVYKMVGFNNTIKSFEFNVFDRWGNIVFAAYDQSFTWTGVDLKGEVLPNGVYTYIVKYATTDAPFDKKINSGSILLEK
jgi:gliding motility-associated-like protein